MEQEKKHFTKTIMIAAVLAVLYIVVCLPKFLMNPFLGIFQSLLAAVFLFCAPWGWALPNKLVAKGNTDYIIPFPLYVALKAFTAFFLGWAGFLYDVYKMFIKK